MAINPLEVGRLPAGKYMIGDPCYFIEDERWSDILDDTWFFNMFTDRHEMGQQSTYRRKSDQGGMFNWEGIYLAAFSTACGDGTYEDNYGFEYGVDAGLLGAIPYDYAIKRYGEKMANQLGHVYDFPDDFVVTSDGEDISFGGLVTIRT